MKHWIGTLREYNGGKEYNFDYLIQAKTEGQAYRTLKAYARDWYELDKPTWDSDTDCWDFFDVAVRVCGVMPITKARFIERMLDQYTLERG